MKNLESFGPGGAQANSQFRSSQRDIMDVPVKDSTGLNDYQKIPNEFGISIPRVGIERFRFPMKFETRSGEISQHDAQASMFVFLEQNKTGVNMSRFCKVLQEEAQTKAVNKSFLKNLLQRFRSDLRDEPTEALIPQAEISLKFQIGLKQPSLKSDNWGWQYYSCEIEALQNALETEYEVTVNYEYSSTCPCSLSMAKQYEEDFAQGKITEGNGIATAHSQRSNAKVTVLLGEEDKFFIEDLIDLLRKAIPTETQSLVKRQDEQAFAILNGENPMFVEHVARRLSSALEKEDAVLNWQAKIEHFESLHSHNAVAFIQGTPKKPKSYIS